FFRRARRKTQTNPKVRRGFATQFGGKKASQMSGLFRNESLGRRAQTRADVRDYGGYLAGGGRRRSKKD
ncbi:MAG: hypothetical protein LBE16_04525, partial [Clostridiales Family XIII bacterium]|nr:hypothetical protein [Clostridiales Family XIII bacterium]